MRTSYIYLIIGGGIAGVTAAETIRSRDQNGTIAIVSGEPHRLYSRVLLPRYIRGDIRREALFLRDDAWYQNERIDVRSGERASFVNTEKKEVGFADHSVIAYEKLLIASGGDAAPSNLDAYDEYVYRLQTLDDADRLHEQFQAKSFREPIIIGSSFIALEFLSLCDAWKIPARVMFRGPHFFHRLVGPEGGEFMKRLIASRGFGIASSDEVADAAEGDGFLRITTSQFVMYDHDAVFLSVGLRRNTDFLAGSGVEIGEGIKTDEYLETAVPGVFAAGDVAEFYDVLFGKRRIVGNWTNAFLQGKLAGLNMTGERLALRALSSYSTTHFGVPIAALGECGVSGDSAERVDFAKNTYERYFFEGNAIVGAVIINRNSVRPHVSRLIETRTPIGSFRDRMSSFSFDIMEIPIVKSESV